MAKHDQHLTTEQLSALIENTLSAQERTQYEAHLQTCAQCQQTLAELRQTVTFLHAMPEPTLPRSFVLSTAMLADVNQQRRRAANPVLPFPAPEARRRNKPGYIYNTMRFVSTIAALIGIVILVGSLFSALPHTGSGGIASSSSAGGMVPAASQNKGQMLPSATNNATHDKGSTPNISGAQTPNIVQTPSNVSAAPQPTDGQTQPSLLASLPNLNAPGGFALLGVILLAFGVLGLLVLRRLKHE